MVSDAEASDHFSHNIQKKSIRMVPAILGLWDRRFRWDAVFVQELLVKPDDAPSDHHPGRHRRARARQRRPHSTRPIEEDSVESQLFVTLVGLG